MNSAHGSRCTRYVTYHRDNANGNGQSRSLQALRRTDETVIRPRRTRRHRRSDCDQESNRRIAEHWWARNKVRIPNRCKISRGINGPDKNEGSGRWPLASGNLWCSGCSRCFKLFPCFPLPLEYWSTA